MGAAALLSLLAATAGAQDVALSPEELRSAAVAQFELGRPDRALIYSEGLVRRDPDDFAAHLIRARAARDLGRFGPADESARAAWALADTPSERYAAAMMRARVLSSRGARTRAQFWLRRAAQNAPTDADRARAVRDFRYVKARNRWSSELSFSIAPSSNVNGGSSSDTTEYYGIPFELQGTAKALSGIEFALGISTTYTLVEREHAKTDIHLSAFHQTYTLSDEARDTAPDVEGSDFAYSSLSFGLTQDWLAPGRRLGGSVGATLSQGWYGGDPLTRTARLTGSLRYVLGPKLVGEASLSRDWQTGLGDREDADSWRAALGAVTVLGPGHRLGLAVSRLESVSDADFLDYDRTGIDLTFSLAKPLPLLDTAVGFGLSAARKHHDETTFGPDGREEHIYGARASFTFNAIDYYGFAPVLTLRADRTVANIGVYDSEEFGMEIGIRSRF
ncbi:hypothetical protein RISW2_06845 [Roseivivax isoporae LMG 25204]|uniref:DUF560 domain-containing protein n=2 Tax=Roseivivax TaxID=93682 RepID=X7F8P0_9RHOB|nr:hypothetical protein RISW2_06845 [Roseivivax isoporae LMG 25204]